MDKFGERLRRILKEQGWTARNFAKFTGIGHDSIIDYINGKRLPKIPSLIRIAKELEVETDWLLGLTDDRRKLTNPFTTKEAAAFCRDYCRHTAGDAPCRDCRLKKLNY